VVRRDRDRFAQAREQALDLRVDERDLAVVQVDARRLDLVGGRSPPHRIEIRAPGFTAIS